MQERRKKKTETKNRKNRKKRKKERINAKKNGCDRMARSAASFLLVGAQKGLAVDVFGVDPSTGLPTENKRHSLPTPMFRKQSFTSEAPYRVHLF